MLIDMNKTSLVVTALAIVAATAIGFVSTQSVAAQVMIPPPPLITAFNTNNDASQSATQTGTAAGGAGGAGGVSIFNSANGGAGGSASVSQFAGQQAAQSGAFGTSNNTFSLP
jgi:hypothetical protein